MLSILKVLNNNTVLVDNKGTEVIVMDKGIGFNKKSGDTIQLKDTSKEFVMVKQENQKIGDNDIVEYIDPVFIEIAAEILTESSEQFQSIDEAVLLPLADHIYFAVKRMKEDLVPSNPFTNDIKLLYPEEYAIAYKAKKIIKDFINVDINEDEIGFITLHVHSAVYPNRVHEIMNATKIVHDSIIKLEEYLDIRIDVDSLAYARLMNHIKFLIVRINTGEKLSVNLDEFTKEKYPFAYNYAMEMCELLSNTLHKPLPGNEIGYLALHIERILSNI